MAKSANKKQHINPKSEVDMCRQGRSGPHQNDLAQKLNAQKRQDMRDYYRIISILGIAGFFPVDAFEEALNKKYQKLSIELEEHLSANEEAKTIKNELDNVFNEIKLDIKPFESKCTLQEYFTIGLSLGHILRISFKDSYFTDKYNIAASIIFDRNVINRVIWLLFYNLENVLLKFNRMNKGLYWISLDDVDRLKDGRPIRKITLHKEDSHEIRLDPGNKAYPEYRPAYQCGQCYYGPGINWIQLKSEQIGQIHEDRIFPVYIQQHALDQLYERLKVIKDAEHLIHDFLWQSLHEPKIVISNNTDIMIEYRFFQHRLGYLTAIKKDDLILITTFLFITMDGTPESNLIKSFMELEKPDKKWLEIDKLETFLFSDIRNDVKLRNLFKNCKCDHLFDIVQEEFANQYARNPRAEEIKMYLCLPDYLIGS